MSVHLSRTSFLVGLALVFTVGLSFASVELPYLVDQALMEAVPTPGFDSQGDEVSRLKTELFISHFHLRAIGYACFAGVVALIAVGFVTGRSGFAALGALAFMLPVFAQFAGVMFFLAGLGLLNVLWLPVLDVSFALSGLGEVIRAPFDFLRWALGLFGVNGYWPVALFFIGSGLLVFFLGTLAWLQARAQKRPVAASLVYRLSRHPQYLGWIVWSYGLYLLLLQARYPRRSWGISASLPWLLSTMVIIGVAMMEELSMRRRHGDAYETYRRAAPFLFPVPRVVERAFALPLRLLYRKKRPTRRREVVVVLALYTAVLVGASSLFYGKGMERLVWTFRSESSRQEYLSGMVKEIREEGNWRRRSSLTHGLGPLGEEAVSSLLALLRDQDSDLREYAAETFRDHPSPLALEALVVAAKDPVEDVRWHAAEALGALGVEEATEPLLVLLEDSVYHIRLTALRGLAARDAEAAIPAALELTRSPEIRDRAEGIRALGSLGDTVGLPAVLEHLQDEDPWVREEAVLALLRIGSPEAVPALERALSDPIWETRVYAAEAIKRLEAGE